MRNRRLRALIVALLITCLWLTLLPVVLIAGILWSSLVLGMALWQALMSKVPQKHPLEITRQATGTHKESSEGLMANDYQR